ncbi:tyrosine-type recombinase/integrase [Akkermansiaceae bacterium]|nr:tyrosine-type recombinase/integrase [Akkermansiaceae bacterium]
MSSYVISWREDLLNSRDLNSREVEGYGFFIGWFEDWRVRNGHELTREASVMFWREVVLREKREAWQKRQWGSAMAWFLNWQEICKSEGREYKSVAERIRVAVVQAGARRGLALRTVKAYAGWAVRYANHANDAVLAMQHACGREFLTQLVTEHEVSFSTQKQALNALVFFFKDVCGHSEVDLEVRFRKTPKRVPVVLSVKEVFALIEKIEPRYRLKAQLQYGAGLRLCELTRLRVKDLDLERGTLVVRGGKGDKDRVTVIPESLKEGLKVQLAKCRELYNLDRANKAEGVHLPNAMGKTMDKMAKSWPWFWLFPARKESKDPRTQKMRRHHLKGEAYSEAVKRAASLIDGNKRVSTHALRHSFDSSQPLWDSPFGHVAVASV